jgi:hypothetical protein
MSISRSVNIISIFFFVSTASFTSDFKASFLTILHVFLLLDALPYLSHSDPVCAIIKQMLLVLHGVHENLYTLNYIALEKLVARVSSPHLGVLGLYYGGSEPILKSNYRGVTRLPIPVIREYIKVPFTMAILTDALQENKQQYSFNLFGPGTLVPFL